MDSTHGSETQRPQLYSPERMQRNNSIVYFSRLFLSIVAGCAAGILGLTGLTGVLFFLVVSLAVSLALLAKLRPGLDACFPHSRNEIWSGGVVQGFLSFVLFWTLLYDIVHLY